MKIKSIRQVSPRRVYAVTTSTGTFIADGLAHHNCYGCNVGKKGAYAEYALILIRKHGDKWFEEKLKLKSKTVKYTVDDLIKLREHYEDKTRQLLLKT